MNEMLLLKSILMKLVDEFTEFQINVVLLNFLFNKMYHGLL